MRATGRSLFDAVDDESGGDGDDDAVRPNSARALLHGPVEHLDHSCLGQISAVLDAEPPYTPRGCVAQAWGATELLRAWVATAAVTSAHR